MIIFEALSPNVKLELVKHILSLNNYDPLKGDIIITSTGDLRDEMLLQESLDKSFSQYTNSKLWKFPWKKISYISSRMPKILLRCPKDTWIGRLHRSKD